MEFLYSTELSIPLFQIMLLLILSSVAVLLRREKLALVINYLFAMYWGYVLNREHVLKAAENPIPYFTELYFAFGIVIIILIVIGFFFQKES